LPDHKIKIEIPPLIVSPKIYELIETDDEVRKIVKSMGYTLPPKKVKRNG